MAEPLVVPDASVLLTWVLRSEDEGDRGPALALKDAWLAGSCRVLVPTLWAFEVANVLGLKQPAAADDLLRAMLDLRLPDESPAACTPVIFRLMREYRVTAYDAAYHALAIVHGGTMLTADRRYVRKAQRAGHLRPIDEWQAPQDTRVAQIALRAGLAALDETTRPRAPFRTTVRDLGETLVGSLDSIEDVLSRAEGPAHR